MRTALKTQNRLPYQGVLTVADLITDDMRLAGVQGDGEAWPFGGVNVQPAATNLCTNGGLETNTTGWTTYNGGSGTVTLTRDTSVSKFGGASARLDSDGASPAQQALMTPGAAPAVSTSTAYSCSMWVYSASGGETVRVRMNWVLVSAYVSATVGATTVLGAGWTRLTVTGTSPASGIDRALPVLDSTLASPVQLWIDGVQFEAGSIATPYIHTDGGTASRSQGRIQVPVAGLFTANQGWIAVRWRSGWSVLPNAAPGLAVWADNVSTQISLRMSSTTAVQILDSAAGNTSDTVPAVTTGSTNTSIAKWTPTDIGASGQGTAFAMLGSRASIPTIVNSLLDIGSAESASAGRPLTGDILWAAAGKGTITDADAALFHSWGNNNPLPHQFPASAQLTFLAHFEGDGRAYRRAV